MSIKSNGQLKVKTSYYFLNYYLKDVDVIVVLYDLFHFSGARRIQQVCDMF